MSSETFTRRVTFEIESCFFCGVLFAIASAQKQQLLRNGTVFYCPNGHAQVYGNSLEERLKRANEEKAQLARKLEISKTARRNEKGTCPCCRRNFSNLQRHMKCKHPEYGK